MIQSFVPAVAKDFPSWKSSLRLLLCLALLMIIALPAHAQVCATPRKDGSPGTITGVINTYYPGIADAAADATSITLGAATGASTGITSGDLLLVIQMQDASINSANSSSYGNGVSGDPGSGYTNVNGVGLYEFVTATNAVPLAGGTVNIVGGGGGGLLNAYNMTAVAGQGQRSFQVVRVPQYGSVTLSSGLTALAWNGSTGGILSLDAADIVTLNNSTVSVTGLGFRGGGGRQIAGPLGGGTDYVNNSPSIKHGSKGEGIAGTPRFVYVASSNTVVDNGVEGYPGGSIARGAPGNAGGGGTDSNPVAGENSGGGGGGNGGAGGIGGNTWDSNLVRGGFGGVAFAQRAAGRVVLGGGGGAGARENTVAAVASSGAAGGGIVIIRAGLVTGTGTITADGAAAYNDTLQDGGGGGGAGGSVVLVSFSGDLTGLTVNARGGRGGDAWRTQSQGSPFPGNRHGPGGGGSGGAVFLSSLPASRVVTGGANAITTTNNSAYGAAPGAAGSSAINATGGQIPGVVGGAQCPDAPTDVAMVDLKATRVDNRVLLEWQTGYEVSNIGFHVYRGHKGDFTRITTDPIAGSALLFGPKVALRAGFAYTWWDNNPPSGDDATYWIEDIDLSGRTSIKGPFHISSSSPSGKLAAAAKTDTPTLGEIATRASQLGSSAPVQRKASATKLTPVTLAAQAANASQFAVKLAVKNEGWYRVEKTDLLAAGFPDADPLKLQLFVDGLEVPIQVTSPTSAPVKGAMPTVAPWDGIEFFGIGIDSPYTDSHIYWLTAGSQNGLRIGLDASQGGAPAPASFQHSVERRDRIVYFAGVKNGGAEKFFGPPIFNSVPVDQSVGLLNIAPTGDATVDVSLQGLTEGFHNVRVLLNGSDLGSVQFNGTAKGTAQYSVPQSSLLEGSNQIQFISPAGFADITLADFVRVTYEHTNKADNNSLRFPAIGSQLATIGGFTTDAIRVVDVTNAAAPQEVAVTVAPDASQFAATFTVPGAGARTLLAFASDQKKTPASLVANQPSSWRTTQNGATYIAVTRNSLISSLDPLLTQRRNQGHKTAIVDIEDVYDEFNFGHKSPQALKDFFAFARTNWKIFPRFALLGGDATYDPKNYTGVGDFDIVPTRLVETNFSETATDDWLVDFNGDSVPDIAIGRLPVRSAQEAASLAAKIIRYDRSQSVSRVLMVADHNDGFDFEAADSQSQALIPANLTITSIRRGQLGSQTRTQLLQALNVGAKFVNFYGHGSTRLWTDAQILKAEDAPNLANTDRLALFDSMTCLTGLFHDVSIESLGEALLKSPGGAIAVWASSGMTDPSNQVLMNEEAIRQLFSGSGLTIGEVTVLAKAATGNADVRRTWILLGDPATKLR